MCNISIMSFQTLPSSLTLYIARMLDFKDVLNLSLVTKDIHKTFSSYETTIWKPLCKQYWLLPNLPAQCISWKDAFVLEYKKYGNCITSYSEVKSLWNKFTSWLGENCPPLLASLQRGINKKKLDSIIIKQNLKLPNALKCSYLIHNGQSYKGDHMYYGIFGNIESIYNLTLTNFETAVKYDTFTINVKKMYDEDGEIQRDYHQFAIINENGQVAVWSLGKLQVVANSFLEWFSQYVNDVINGRYAIEKEEIIPYHLSTQASKTTGCFSVTVRWLHLLHPVDNKKGANYSYRITIAMDENAPQSQSCRLYNKKWFVTDGVDGEERSFETIGVKGEFPVLTPGSEYTWVTYHNLPLVVGSMEGYFVMRLLSDDETELNLFCPKFTMMPFYNGKYIPYEVEEE